MFEAVGHDLVLSAAGAWAAFGLGKAIAFIGAAAPRPPAMPLARRYRVGDVEVITLVDGIVEVPHNEGYIRNADVAQTRAALRAAGLADGGVPIPFTLTALVMGRRLVLIDAGTGGFAVYGPDCGWLPRSMAAAGLDPAAVDSVLVSHLHGDHIYGLMEPATLAQTFPRSEIVVPADELRWWTRPEVDAMDLGPTRAGLAARIRASLAAWPNVRPFEGGGEIIPGVRAIPAPGHSPGQVAHLIDGGGRQLLASADVSLLPALFLRRPWWQVVLDQDPGLAVATRRRIFERAVADGVLVSGSHWLPIGLGTLARDGAGYAFVAAEAADRARSGPRA